MLFRVQKCIFSGNIYDKEYLDPNLAYSMEKKAKSPLSSHTSMSPGHQPKIVIAPKDGCKTDIPSQLQNFTYKSIMD